MTSSTTVCRPTPSPLSWPRRGRTSRPPSPLPPPTEAHTGVDHVVGACPAPPVAVTKFEPRDSCQLRPQRPGGGSVTGQQAAVSAKRGVVVALLFSVEPGDVVPAAHAQPVVSKAARR